jgi:hypothetical protein
MPIADPFSYYGRFDSMEFDCSMCKYYSPPPKWPDVNKVSQCNFHNISLAFELGATGYKLGMWFCKHFEPAKSPFTKRALEEFETIKDEMEDAIIYSGYNGNFLFERKI